MFGKTLVSLPLLEIHVAHACNLTCESCSHFSNNGHKGILSLEEFKAWCTPWTSKLAPKVFRMLGGEPTVNPQLGEIVLKARALWPNSQLTITTNGFYLHRHPHLADILGQTRTSVRLTRHDNSPAYTEKWQKARNLLLDWKARRDFPFFEEISYERWTRRHKGYGAQVLPFADGNASASWQRCPARHCVQLFEGKIWKCSPLAYLQLQKKHHSGISPAWDPYLAYRPLEMAASMNEISDFLSRTVEPFCGMCPANPERFQKASPLIPVVDLLPVKV